MILGIGIDICDSRRIKKNLIKYGEKFSNYILTEKEIKQGCLENNFTLYVASRFSAKESFYKAFNTPSQTSLNWKDLEVLKNYNNINEFYLSQKAETLLKEFLPSKSSYKIDFSIGLSKDYIICNTMISYF